MTATISMMDVSSMLDELEQRSSMLPNDKRQENYCGYINIVTENYGDERVYLVGSTKEGTHLRTDKNGGDYDYLLVSGINIPVELLQYREDVPCFVHIDARSLQSKLNVELVNGKYLPSDLLKTFRSEAFTIIRGFQKIFTLPTTSKRPHTFQVCMRIPNKLGITMEEFDHFECDLIPEEPKLQHSGRIRELFAKHCLSSDELRSNEMLGAQNNVSDNFSKVFKVAQAMRPPENIDSIFYQNIGNLAEALSGSKTHQKDKYHYPWSQKTENDSSQNIKKPRLSLDQRPKRGDEEDEKGAIDISEPVPSISTSSSSENACVVMDTNLPKEAILVRYKSKSHKDFIGAFRLIGKPASFNEKLRQRLSSWLTQEQINDIFDSEFYVVGKPAVTNPKDDIDFCLSYNQAELKLAKAMSRGQRRCMLMLKAFQRSALVEFSEILTTFHWKTVLYWKSEELDPTSFSDDLILEALTSILEYMIDCLCNRNLEHYFIESNLFAGMDEDTTKQIAEKVIAICEDPMTALRNFFEREKKFYDTFQTEEMPRSKLEEIRRLCYEAKDESYTHNIVSALGDIARAIPNNGERRPGQRDFSEVLVSVAAVAFKDMLKEQTEEAELNKQKTQPLYRVETVTDNPASCSSSATASQVYDRSICSSSSAIRTESPQHNVNQGTSEVTNSTILNFAQNVLSDMSNSSIEDPTENILGDLRSYLSLRVSNERESDAGENSNAST